MEEREIEFAYKVSAIADECLQAAKKKMYGIGVENHIHLVRKYGKILAVSKRFYLKTPVLDMQGEESYEGYIEWLISEMPRLESHVHAAWLIKQNHELLEGLSKTDLRFFLHEALQSDINCNYSFVSRTYAYQDIRGKKRFARLGFINSYTNEITYLHGVQEKLRQHASSSDPRMRI